MRLRRRSISLAVMTALLVGAMGHQALAANPKSGPGLTPQPSADVSIVGITESSDPAMLALELKYTIVVRNEGPSVGSVRLDATLDGANHMRSSSTSTQGSCGPELRSIACALGELAPGASATITVTTRPTGLGTLTLSAVAWSGLPDPNTSNNSKSEWTTVTVAP